MIASLKAYCSCEQNFRKAGWFMEPELGVILMVVKWIKVVVVVVVKIKS